MDFSDSDALTALRDENERLRALLKANGIEDAVQSASSKTNATVEQVAQPTPLVLSTAEKIALFRC